MCICSWGEGGLSITLTLCTRVQLFLLYRRKSCTRVHRVIYNNINNSESIYISYKFERNDFYKMIFIFLNWLSSWTVSSVICTCFNSRAKVEFYTYCNIRAAWYAYYSSIKKNTECDSNSICLLSNIKINIQ